MSYFFRVFVTALLKLLVQLKEDYGEWRRFLMESENNMKKRKPLWLKWIIGLIFAYVGLLVLVLAAAIVTMTGTFTLIVLELFIENQSLRDFNEQYLVPASEFSWNLFTRLVPGL